MIGLLKPKTVKTELTAWLGMILLTTGIAFWSLTILSWLEIEVTVGWKLFSLMLLPLPAAVISDAIVVYYHIDDSDKRT